MDLLSENRNRQENIFLKGIFHINKKNFIIIWNKSRIKETERGGVMEYIGESSAIYYWRALGLIVSVLILYVVFEMQKKKMSRLSSANTHSSIVLLHKRHAGNPNYSSSTEICRIDGLRAEAFLYCVGVQAVYLSPGEHNIEVNAHWARHIRGKRFKEYEAGPHHLCVEVGHGELWSLEYFIPEKKFIFSRCNEKKMFKKSVV